MNPIVEALPDSPGMPGDQTAPYSAVNGESSTHLAIADRFNIDIPNKQEDNKLAEIWQYASGLSETKEISDVIWQVINLEQIVGIPRLGESRLDRLYRYAKLRRQESQIREQLKNVTSSYNL